VITTLEEAVQEMKRGGMRPVRTVVDGIEIELRPVETRAAGTSAAGVFNELGPWAGESLAEVQDWLAEARATGTTRSVPRL